MVKNHRLAKSINDASWYKFREWLEYFGSIYGVPVIAVEPHYTSIECSGCGNKVSKTFLHQDASMRLWFDNLSGYKRGYKYSKKRS